MATLTDEKYFPELDYKSRGYAPFKGRKNHFCLDCIEYYKKLYDKGLTKRPFPFNYKKDDGTVFRGCSLDRRTKVEELKPEDFETDEQFEEAKRVVDPLTWAYVEMGWEPRWYQEEILACSSQFKAVRAGRRIGKSEAISLYCIWRACTKKRFKILVLCPFVSQVNIIFDNIRRMMSMMSDVRTVRDIHSPPQEIELPNGSRIRGFAVGGSGVGADQVRGQDADVIVIDECDLVSGEAMEVIQAILSSNDKVEMIVSSTPNGEQSMLYRNTRDKDEPWKEFHYISAESPKWTSEAERMHRATYSPGGYNREFNAEFGGLVQGVFRDVDLTNALQDYEYSSCQPDHVNFIYGMGVDWNNPVTGTHIVVIERPRANPMTYKVVEKKIIRRVEFTYTKGVEAIIELDRKWKPQYVYCDEGHGSVQMEMIWKMDEEFPSRMYKKRFKAISMGGNIEMPDPESTEPNKKPTKGFMVDLAARELQAGRVIFPASEDTGVNIIPEELPTIDIGIVQQARNYKVEHETPTGRLVYSNEYEHTLVAWMLALMSLCWEFSDYNEISYVTEVMHMDGLQPQERDKSLMYDSAGNKLPPAQIHAAMMAAAERRKEETEKQREEFKNTRRQPLEPPDNTPTMDPKENAILVAENGVPVQNARFARFRSRERNFVRRSFRFGTFRGRGGG